MQLKLMIRFPPVTRDLSSALLVSFSDAAHGGKEFDYGQTDGIYGLRISLPSAEEELFYGISWTSGKRRRISHSSFGVEIAAAEMDERSFELRETIREIFRYSGIRHEMIVYSKDLFDKITTLKESRKDRLRRTVYRYSFF